MIFAILLWLFSESAHALPELSRFGYVSCTACHVSPSGGGLLTSYGREASREVLSAFSYDGEQKPFYVLPQSDSYLVGAFVRGLQAHRETPQSIDGRWITMQTDTEFGFNSEKVAVVVSAGLQERTVNRHISHRFISRRSYVLVRPFENLSLRAGKFLRSFGLMDPNHNLLSRRELGLGIGAESYNAEAAYESESFRANLTYFNGNHGDDTSLLIEQGYALNTAFLIKGKNLLGFSGLAASDATSRRWAFGPYGVISWTKKLFSTSELFFQNRQLKGVSDITPLWVTSHKLNYQLFKGFIPFVMSEGMEAKRGSVITSAKTNLGLGVQLFPRPHWEIIASWQKEEVKKPRPITSDLFWLMLHLYL